MTLAEYVDRTMRERGLSAYAVAKRSGGQIADSYVVRIRQGKSRHPSALKLRALAKGLGVHFNALVEVAAGAPPPKRPMKEIWTPESLAHAISKMVRNENLGEAVRLLLSKNDQELKSLIARLKRSK